jgi:hypothetical protein
MTPERFIVIFDGGVIGAEPRRGFTPLLGRARAGDERARGELLARVDDELRQVATRLTIRSSSGASRSAARDIQPQGVLRDSTTPWRAKRSSRR